ncbi:hypothetical protein D770_04310 [Flammeovirgaceae bacterium 311]|nr:hypothetical protein D770_04310 [Flammeovirgaceae bacterium 311]
MISFLDYFYYRCFDYYSKRQRQGVPVFWSSAIMAVVIGINLLCLLVILNMIFTKKAFSLEPEITLTCTLTVWAVLYYRYKFIQNYQELNQRWGADTNNDRRLKGRKLLMYVSIILLGLGVLPFLNNYLR